MPSQDILKVVLHWSGYGEEGTTAVHFQSAGSHSDSLLSNAAGNIDTMFGTDTSPSTWDNLQSLLTTEQTWDEITVYQYDDLPGSVSNIGRHAVSKVGTYANAPAPLQVACAVKLLTAEAGATKRGRIYMPGHCALPTTATARWSAGFTQEFATTAAGMINTMSDALAQTLNASDPLDAVVYSPTKGYVTPITHVEADNRPDIQRRRAAQLQPTYTSTVNLG